MIVGILDGQTIQALIFAKQLRGKGHKVILFCSEKLSYGYMTRYLTKKIICPSSKNNISAYHNFILNYVKNNTVDVLVPMNDDSAKYLSSYKTILSKYSNFSIPNLNVFMMGYDKNQLMQVCNEKKFPHPKTIDLEKKKPLINNSNFKFPALIKPNETSGARGFIRVHDFDEAQKVYPSLKKIWKVSSSRVYS